MFVKINRNGLEIQAEVSDTVLPTLLQVCGILQEDPPKETTTCEKPRTYKLVGFKTGERIAAIRIMRILRGMFLSEAKNLVENLRPTLPWIYDPKDNTFQPDPTDPDQSVCDSWHIRDNWHIFKWDGPIPPCPV